MRIPTATAGGVGKPASLPRHGDHALEEFFKLCLDVRLGLNLDCRIGFDPLSNVPGRLARFLKQSKVDIQVEQALP